MPSKKDSATVAAKAEGPKSEAELLEKMGQQDDKLKEPFDRYKKEKPQEEASSDS